MANGATAEDWLTAASRRLATACDNPRQEARWLMAAIQGDAARSAGQTEPTAVQLQAFEAAVDRRARGEPLAYITGEQPFWRHAFEVSPAVLIPRPETEHLLEWALALIAPGQRVLDACTGSGCVVLSLACERPDCTFWASDVSGAALQVAQRNGQRLGATVQWVQADGLAFAHPLPPLHLITANPPYIAEGDPHLPALGHEPRLALVSGPDGLDLIRRLIAQAPQWLLPGGALLLEHGYDQGEAVRALFAAAGWRAVETRRDYSARDRVTGARWHG